MAPTSNREISSRSSTSCWNRSTSADSRSSAVWARSGISSREFSSTSTEADSVISGERSSWLTSDAKRASRSMRSSSASAISLNGTARTVEVGVVADAQPGVEPTAGDGLGGVRPRRAAG